jgi:putative transposase
VIKKQERKKERKKERKPSDKWHPDEKTVRIRGETFILWRAVDQEGIELDVVLQRRRDKTTTGGLHT